MGHRERKFFFFLTAHLHFSLTAFMARTLKLVAEQSKAIQVMKTDLRSLLKMKNYQLRIRSLFSLSPLSYQSLLSWVLHLRGLHPKPTKPFLPCGFQHSFRTGMTRCSVSSYQLETLNQLQRALDLLYSVCKRHMILFSLTSSPRMLTQSREELTFQACKRATDELTFPFKGLSWLCYSLCLPTQWVSI